MTDVSLATFYVFDMENVGSGMQLARGCGGCGGFRGCGAAFGSKWERWRSSQANQQMRPPEYRCVIPMPIAVVIVNEVSSVRGHIMRAITLLGRRPTKGRTLRQEIGEDVDRSAPSY